MIHALLLNYNYEFLSLLNERDIYKFLLKENKVEVVSSWDDEIKWFNSKMKIPSVLRMKYLIRIPRLKSTFSRKNVFIRDQFICQYCGYALSGNEATWDHLLPRARGGESTWLNCVTSCKDCNSIKGNRLPEEAGMKLLNKPHIPLYKANLDLSRFNGKTHPHWDFYVKKYR